MNERHTGFDSLDAKNAVVDAFRKRVKIHRILKDISQAQLAEKLNICLGHLSEIECGKRGVSFTLAVAIAQALGVTLNDLYLVSSSDS
jgi:transcriptional regulator with XRE-family HTH domain